MVYLDPGNLNSPTPNPHLTALNVNNIITMLF